MGIAFGILALGGTEPEIHLGVIYPPNCNVRLKNTFATLGLSHLVHSVESFIRTQFNEC